MSPISWYRKFMDDVRDLEEDPDMNFPDYHVALANIYEAASEVVENMSEDDLRSVVRFIVNTRWAEANHYT